MTRPAFAPVIAEQTRIRHDHQAAQERRAALRRAQRRCEDLTELLGALGARQSPDDVAALRATARTTACDLHRLVALGAGPGPQPPPTLRQRRQSLTTAVDDLVEQLAEAISDVRAGFRASQRALALAAVVAAGVEALTSAGG
jgi:hypothetical protein